MQPAQLAGEIHRRLAPGTLGQLRRVDAVVGDDDGDIGRGRVGHGRDRVPRDTGDSVSRQQPSHPCVVSGARESVEREHRRNERRRRGVPAELFDQYRNLDRTEPEAAAGFVHLDAEPTLIDHRAPERAIERGIGRRVGADARGRSEVVEELTRARAQGELILGEVEIHVGPSLAGGVTTASTWDERRTPERPIP